MPRHTLRLAATILAFALALLSGCAESIFAPEKGRIEEGIGNPGAVSGSINIENGTLQPVQDVRLRECGEADWGENFLDRDLLPGKSVGLGTVGCYDLRAEAPQRKWERRGVEVEKEQNIRWKLR